MGSIRPKLEPMDERALQFPDAPRGELEKTISELISKAQSVLGAQGRLRGLLRANRAVTEELDLERVLSHIVAAAIELVDARYGALGVIDESGLLERFIHVGILPEEATAIGHLPEGHGLLGAVVKTGESIRLTDLNEDPRATGFPAGHPAMVAFLGVPIRVRDRIFGNLYLTKPAEGAFSEEDQELIESLAATAGIAIENARLYDQARRQERVAAAQSEVRAALLSPDNDVLGVVADRVAAVVPVGLVTVVVPEPDGANMRIDVARGTNAEAVKDLVFPADGSPPGRAMAGHELITVNSWSLSGGIAELGPTAVIPLLVGGRTVGALCVSRESDGAPFTHPELTAISDFAAQAGIAISLARAQRDRQRLQVIEDRSRIARDLHDHVIQRLFATGLGLQALAARVPEQADAIDGHVAEIDAAIADIRTAIFTLRNRQSSSPARQQLLDLIAEISPTLASTPRLTFAGPVDLVLHGPVAEDVMAVVRESLANVARHAHAQTTSVDVAVTDREVSVRIEDDGVGIDPGTPRASGTVNLEKRALARGGTYTLGPTTPHGTCMQWRVPVGG
jgi:signal transduction histidine kinase